MSTSPDTEYLTVAEAAKLFKVSQSTVWRWINQGAIPAYRIGQRGVRLKKAELASLVTRARQGRSERGKTAGPEHNKLGRLSKAEQKAGLEALAKLRTLREELLRQRGEVLFPSAAEDLHELREQHSEERQ